MFDISMALFTHYNNKIINNSQLYAKWYLEYYDDSMIISFTVTHQIYILLLMCNPDYDISLICI